MDFSILIFFYIFRKGVTEVFVALCGSYIQADDVLLNVFPTVGADEAFWCVNEAWI